MPRRKKRNYKPLKTLLLIVFLGFIGIVAFYAIQNSESNMNENENSKEVREFEDGGIENEELITAGDNEKENVDSIDMESEEEKKEEEDDGAIGGSSNKNTYKTILAGQNMSFEYPDTWQANKLEEKNKFSFGPKGKAIATEYEGDVIIAYKENESEKPIEIYYDGINNINLFEDASGGFEKEEGVKYDFYKFKDVIGYTPSTIGVFVLDDSFVEMTDVYNKHQDDGVFDQLVMSFRAE